MNRPAVARRTFFGLEYQFDAGLANCVPDFFGGPCRARITISIPPEGRDGDWRVRYLDGELSIEEDRQGQWLRVRYADGPTFDLRRDGSEVCALTMGSSLEDIASCVLGPISGFLLYLRGTTCLHAGAIAYQHRALAFVGAAEAGKSTLAGAFARSGHRVLTDDILALERRDGEVLAQPAIPRIGLWPDSVERLWGNAEALPRQTATWAKRRFDLLSEDLYQRTALPIGAVYVLANREPDTVPRFIGLNGTDAVLALIANKYVTRYLEREQNKRDFILLSELATSVPIRRITRSDALTDLNATCDAILADYNSLALAPG